MKRFVALCLVLCAASLGSFFYFESELSAGRDVFVPIKADGPCCLIVSKTALRAGMPSAKQAIFSSTELWAYADAHFAKSKEGAAEFRILDPGATMDNESQLMRDAMKLPRGGDHWIIISDGKRTGESRELPSSVPEVLALFRKYNHDHTPPSTGPPSGREFIIGEHNFHEFIGDGKVLPADSPFSGGEARYFSRMPRKSQYGSLPYAQKFDLPLIPRSEWPARIKEMEATKSRLSDLCTLKQIPCLDQDGTSYCHANSPTGAMMAMRAMMGEPFVSLSPGSIGGPVTNYRNQGAYIERDLQQIVEHGVASVDFVPPNQVSRSGWKPGAEENAKLHRVTEWYDLGGHDRFDQVMTCLFARIPVCVGLDWWSHAVTYYDPYMSADGKFGVRFRNSWGAKWGENGYSILMEGKGTPDEAYAPSVATPSIALIHGEADPVVAVRNRVRSHLAQFFRSTPRWPYEPSLN